MEKERVAVVGAGAMGTGMAQVALAAGHPVRIYDPYPEALEKSRASLRKGLDYLESKGKIPSAEALAFRASFHQELGALKDSDWVLEAIVENEEIKKKLFAELEAVVSDQTILATNTSSLSVTALARACQRPERFLGIHFFNPAPRMALVEVIPALQTDPAMLKRALALIASWSKVPVQAQDSPGFIVNRVARPFYGEALRILEEGKADIPTIDWAMEALGGFRMGPFKLMDYIGHDVNYVVTETVFRAMYYDRRYIPSLVQKRLVDAGWLGRKSGRGFYDYRPQAPTPAPRQDEAEGRQILDRILAMLINEAVDALYMGVASEEDLDRAMTRGVNYPKGLIQWGRDIGFEKVLYTLDRLQQQTHDDRYRASPLLRQWAAESKDS